MLFPGSWSVAHRPGWRELVDAAGQPAGGRVDGDAVGAGEAECDVVLVDHLEAMAARREIAQDVLAQPGLAQGGRALAVGPWRRHGVLDAHAEVEDVDQALEDRGHDP